MMFRHLVFATLVLGLAACNEGAPTPPQPTPPSSSWVIGPIVNGVNYSPGVVWNGSGFTFPTAAPGIHGLTRGVSVAESGRAQITMGFSISGSATFTEVDAGDSASGPGPGQIRLFLQRCGDDWGGGAKASYRFYSKPVDLGVLSALMQVPLTADQWANVNGQNDADGFYSALVDLCTVGMGFGGMFAMHGVYATGDAVFTLNSYAVE